MSKRTKTTNVILEFVLWIFSIIVIYPILMVVFTSFKTKGEASYLNISLPKVWMFENYKTVWEQGNVLRSLINSCIITITAVLIVIALTSMLSYAVVRRNTKPCRFLYRFMTFGIIAPFAALPTIQLLKQLGLYGGRTGLIFVYSALYIPFSTMLFTSFIKGIPKELDEAAVMDGGKGGKLFVLVIFPLLKPVLATTAILNFMWIWNELQIPMYLLNSADKWTLPLSVYNFYGQYSRSWNLVCADMVLISIPVILVYIFAQKYIIAGMTAGAVKG